MDLSTNTSTDLADALPVALPVALLAGAAVAGLGVTALIQDNTPPDA